MQRFSFYCRKDCGAAATHLYWLQSEKKKKQLCKLERELPHSTNKHIHKERKNESEEKGQKRKLIKPKAEEEYNALPCLLISRKLLALCL